MLKNKTDYVEDMIMFGFFKRKRIGGEIAFLRFTGLVAQLFYVRRTGLYCQKISTTRHGRL